MGVSRVLMLRTEFPFANNNALFCSQVITYGFSLRTFYRLYVRNWSPRHRLGRTHPSRGARRDG